MFFAKALGGSLVVVFAGFWAAGAFDAPLTDHERGVLKAVNLARQAEIADNKTAKWGPHCDKLRDKVFGMEDGMPVGDVPASGLQAIGKLRKAAAELEAAGCDVDAAPGAFSPFEPDKSEFRTVTNTMGDPAPRGSPHSGAHGAPPVTQDLHPDGGWGKPKP